MKFSLKIISLLLIGLFVFSCAKDESDPNALLVDYSWVYNRVTSASADPFVQLAVTLVNAFMTDATYTFRADGTYTLAALDQSEDGTWELSEDGKTLTFEKGTVDENDVTITKITKDELVWEAEEDNEGDPYTVVFYWDAL